MRPRPGHSDPREQPLLVQTTLKGKIKDRIRWWTSFQFTLFSITPTVCLYIHNIKYSRLRKNRNEIMMKLSIFFFSHTTWKLKRSATGQSVCNMTRQARWRKPASWWNQQPRWNLLFQNGHLLSISSTIFTVNFALKIENKYRELKLSFKGFLKGQFTRRLCVGDSSMWNSKWLDQ